MSIDVVAVGAEGEAGRWPLLHGQDPIDLLAENGWAGEPVRTELVGGQVEVHYDVRPRASVAKRVEIETGAAGARTLQRLGAYAIVVSEGRLLLTQLAQSVSSGAGLWTLPGGGVHPGEAPLDGVVREVHEEAGQHVVVDALVQVLTRHSVGDTAVGERHEDFHSVGLIHLATCPHPTPAHVVEVDGSTADAAWVPLPEVAGLELGHLVRRAWAQVPGGISYPL